MLLAGGASPLPGIFGSLAPVLDSYGYAAVAGLITLEHFGIPLPGETILVAAALYAGAGRLNIVLVALVAFTAAVAGSSIGFAIGRFGGRPAVERVGRYVFLTADRLDRAERFFARRGFGVVIVARFIEGLRQAVGIIAGISEMPFFRFLVANAIGAALWVAVWAALGDTAGSHITTIYRDLSNYGLYALGVLAAGLLGWFLLHRRRRRHPST